MIRPSIVLSVLVALLAIRLAWVWERATPVSEPGTALAELTTVSLGGQLHYVSLRSSLSSLENAPVLLILHGGPGASNIPFMHQTDCLLEEHFVVVNYDQRSAGKSCKYYNASVPLTIDQHVLDAVDMIRYLQDRFKLKRVYVLGSSWGSVIALLLARDYAHLVQHVAVRGLVVDTSKSEVLSNEFILSKLPDFEGKSPPYGRDIYDMVRQRGWLYRAGGMKYKCSFEKCFTRDLTLDFVRAIMTTPEMSWADFVRFRFCYMHTLKEMWYQVEEYKAPQRIGAPLLVLHGRHDHCTDASLVSDYVDSLEAPRKKLIWFEDSAHAPHMEQSESFQMAVIRELLESPAIS